MINQVPISARIDSWTKWRVDQFSSKNHTTRNRMINDGLRILMDLETIRGSMRYVKTMESRMKILKLFLKTWIPELDPENQLQMYIQKSEPNANLMNENEKNQSRI